MKKLISYSIILFFLAYCSMFGVREYKRSACMGFDFESKTRIPTEGIGNSGGVYFGEVTQKGDYIIPHGCGRAVNQREEFSYEGEFFESAYHGQGTYKGKQYTYEGEFQKNKKHGRGSIVFHTDNERYDGDFFEGKYEGRGKRYAGQNMC